MSYATVAPGQSSSNTPPVCNTCHTSNTPLWRRDENGNVLCNACGLFLKLHGRDRPISLKTNVVKSRKRVKATGPPGQQGPQQKKKKPSSVDPSSVNGSSSQQQGLPEGYQNAQSSAQQSDTPNIAPQHMFDSITLDAANQQSLANLYNSGYAPQRNASPSASSLLNGIAGSQNGHLDVPQTSTELVASNNHLKTRVSELEVINNLFRERVAELENGESETKRALEEALTRINELEAKVSELEGTASKTTPEGDVQDASKSRLSQATE